MDSWFLKNLGDALMAFDEQAQLETLFNDAYQQAGCPEDMTAFVRHESDGRLHCEVKVYFPPNTAVLAQSLGAVACPKPSPEGLGILAGSADPWHLLFPQ